VEEPDFSTFKRRQVDWVLLWGRGCPPRSAIATPQWNLGEGSTFGLLGKGLYNGDKQNELTRAYIPAISHDVPNGKSPGYWRKTGRESTPI